MNYKDHCRTCLSSNQEMRPGNTTIIIGEHKVRLTEILEDFYDYKVTPDSDTMPDNICINCIYQLTITFSFKLLIDSSNKKLIETTNIVKTDFDDNEDEKPQPEDSISHEIIFCVECKEQFTSKNTLLEHCNANHPVQCHNGRDCKYCEEKFTDFRSLIMHTKLHTKPYLCEKCWEGFYKVTELRAHTCIPNKKRDARKDREGVLHQCDQCGKSYPAGYIKMHVKTHSNNTPYACQYCPKRFKVPRSLNSHVLWNHKRTRNHTCEVCNATFISASARSTHVRKHHLKEKNHSCKNCGKSFFRKSELERHSLKHSGIKNFHCDMCSKSYQTRYGLKVHLKSHSNIDD